MHLSQRRIDLHNLCSSKLTEATQPLGRGLAAFEVRNFFVARPKTVIQTWDNSKLIEWELLVCEGSHNNWQKSKYLEKFWVENLKFIFFLNNKKFRIGSCGMPWIIFQDVRLFQTIPNPELFVFQIKVWLAIYNLTSIVIDL